MTSSSSGGSHTPAAAPPPSGASKGIGLVLALIVFVILLFVVIGRKDTGNTKVGVKELNVQKIEKESVTKLEVALPPKKDPTALAAAAADAGPAPADVKREVKRVVLEKDGEAWKVYDPQAPDKKFGADETQVKTALDAVAEFATTDLIANKQEKHADLEIDEEKGHHVKVFVKNNASPALDLVFGRAAKGGGSTVREASGVDVFVAKGRLGSVMKKELPQWRKKQLFDVKADELTRVSITHPDGGKLVFEGAAPPPPADLGPDAGPAPPAPKVEWKLVEPATLPAGFRLDKAQLARPASSLASVRAQDFADAVSDSVAGFDGPHTVVEATAKDGKKIVLHLGKEDDKKRVHARLEGDPQIYLFAQYTAKQLQKSLDDLRELTLLDGKPDDVERVAIKGSQGLITIKKDGDTWKMLEVEPKVPPPDFDPAQVPVQLGALLRTRAARAVTNAPADAFKSVGPTVDITFKGGKKQTLRFGGPLPVEEDASMPKAPDAKPTKQEPREYYVKGSVDDLTYAIASFNRNRYDKPAEIFKKPPAPPPGMGGPGGPGGNIPGMENLPPDVRKKLEESLKKGDFPGGGG